MANQINPGKDKAIMPDLSPPQLGNESSAYSSSDMAAEDSAYRSSSSTHAESNLGKINLMDKEEVKQQASRLTEQARAKTETYVAGQKDVLAEQLVGIADAVRQTARYLSENNRSSIASYAEQAAQGMDRFSNSLRQQDLGSIINQSKDLARRQPALFFGTAVGIGLLLSRFIKSSASSSTQTSSSSESDMGVYASDLATEIDRDYESPEVQRGINDNSTLKGI